jgi:serine/threonine protein kinase
VHRDVKPGNVLLTSVHERSDHVYLTDFGLTKRASSLTGGLTGTGHFLGTIDYVAPEQIAGKPVDARTDIYALGCVLYESLTGQVPFHREDDAATLWAHLVEPPPPVTAVRPDLSPAVGAVIARAMAKDQEDRYGSCHEMVQDLEQALEVVPSRGRAASGGVGASWPAGQLEREHEQQTHITDAPPHEPPDASPHEPPDASPDEPQHPSFPPGIVDVRSGSRYPEQGEESGPTWEEVDEELAPEGSLGDIGWESEDEPARSAPPPARSSKRGRWWLVAVLAVVAAFAVVAALVLLPAKKSPTLSGTYTSSSSVFKAYVGSFSLNTPADWGPREGPSVSVILSPGVEAVDQLFSQASWAAVRNLLSTNRSNASGLWITARDTPYGGTPQELVKSGALPNLSKITSSPQNRLVGDMPSDEMQGQLEDPDDQTVRLQFVVNVVRYHKAQSTASMLVVFFAPPDKFNHQRPLFDQVRSTIRFS